MVILINFIHQNISNFFLVDICLTVLFDPHVTRWINGAIESFIGTCKRKEKSLLNLMPAQYANYTYPIAIGNVDDFEEIFKKKTEKKNIITKTEKKPSKTLKKTTEKQNKQATHSTDSKPVLSAKASKAPTTKPITTTTTISLKENSNKNKAPLTPNINNEESPQIDGPAFGDEQPPSIYLVLKYV